MPNPLAKPLDRVREARHTPPVPGRVVSIGEEAIAWAESPVHALHEQLLTSFLAPDARGEPMLPARARLAILVGSTAALWLAITLVITALRDVA